MCLLPDRTTNDCYVVPLWHGLSKLAKHPLYTGEYYHRFNIPDNPTNCFCSGTPILQSRDHIIRDCPMYDEGRSALLTQFPRLQNPRFQLSSLFLFRRDRQPHDHSGIKISTKTSG